MPNPPGCTQSQVGQKLTDLQKNAKTVGLAVGAASAQVAKFAIDNFFFPDGLTADKAAALEKKHPGADLLLRLATAASPVAGLATNLPRAHREKMAKWVENALMLPLAHGFEQNGDSWQAAKLKNMIEEPYEPRTSMARMLGETWRELSQKK